MSNKLRWMAPVIGCLLAPLHALATSSTSSIHTSAGLAASLAVVLGLVGAASAGAAVLDWYASRQRVQRHERAALALAGAQAGRVVPLRPVLQVATPAVAAAAQATAAPGPSGRRAQAMRSRRPGLSAVRGFGQPSQIASQFGHLN